jgi:hypothetical protein
MIEKNAWYLPIVGSAESIDDLQRILAGVDAEIIHPAPRTLLTSPVIKHASGSTEALRLGTELMTVVARVYRTLRGRGLGVALQNTTYNEDTTSPKILTYHAPAEALTVGVTIVGGSLVEVGADTREESPLPVVDPLWDVQQLVAKSLRYPEIARALAYMEIGDYVSLYKLYEIIKTDLGKDSDLTDPPRQYIDRAVLKRITHNLNSPALSGELARHAVASSGQPRPTDRMEPGEIVAHLRTLFLRWAADKT